jgi:hypothetical protein
MIALDEGKQALFKKSAAKTFVCAGPEALKPHGPKVNKVFLLLFVHKKKPSPSPPFRFAS